MRLALKRNSLFALVFVAGAASGLLAAPLWRWALVQLNQDQYGELTFLCDSAMRAHYLAKAQLNEAPGAADVERLRQTEIALIDCQDYDMMQKRLMLLGLRESELGFMRLRAIEANAAGLHDVVGAHEIRD